MPWINESIRHDSLLDELAHSLFRRFESKEGIKWWYGFDENTPIIEIYKIAFTTGLLVKSENDYVPSKSSSEGSLAITRHILLRRWDGEILGLAQSTGAVSVKPGQLPNTKEELYSLFADMFKSVPDYSTLYVYTIENYLGDMPKNGEPLTVISDDGGVGALHASLDLEYRGHEYIYEDMMQSPIVTLKLRENKEEKIDYRKGRFVKAKTNWWDDSEVVVQGVFDESSVFLMFKADSNPTWEDNRVTLVPLFFGNLVVRGKERMDTPIALFGGSQVGKDFDFESSKSNTPTMQPISKDYMYNPSNGVDSVMVKRSKYGARYQANYIRWNVPPNLMPPTRHEIRLIEDAEGEELEEFKRMYPRAWNYLRKGYYDYSFKKSRYSDKIHSSRATVVHPEDGVVGHIPNIVLIASINLYDEDRLNVPIKCKVCVEEPYKPEKPDSIPKKEWKPSPSSPTPPPSGDDSGGNPGGDSGSDSGSSSGGDGTENPTEPPNPTDIERFKYHCDDSLDVTSVDQEYWKPSDILQDFLSSVGAGTLKREMNTAFWEGRNDLLDIMTNEAANGFSANKSKITKEDFHVFLLESIKRVKEGTYSVSETWQEFKTFAADNLPCLTELQVASLFTSVKLEKPTLFFKGSEGFLEGSILDTLISFTLKVPNKVYDWMDFHDVMSDSGGGITGAFASDMPMILTSSTGEVVSKNALDCFQTYINVEPQLLMYGVSAAICHRPFDYIKVGDGFGEKAIDGEYSDYYLPDMTDSNFMPYVAGEVLVHEMAHSVAFYAFDKLGESLHDMQEWLDISGWEKDSSGNFPQLTKSSVGTIGDNGKLAPVSDYGCFMPAEDFAEAFRMYVVNKKFLQDKFKAKHDFIESKLSVLGLS